MGVVPLERVSDGWGEKGKGGDVSQLQKFELASSVARQISTRATYLDRFYRWVSHHRFEWLQSPCRKRDGGKERRVSSGSPSSSALPGDLPPRLVPKDPYESVLVSDELLESVE